MRMWGVDVKKMCTKHLLGEHVEMHMFVGHIRLGKALGKFVSKGLVDTRLIQSRHDEIASEIERRGFKHDSPLDYQDGIAEGRVDVHQSARDLRQRCKNCQF